MAGTSAVPDMRLELVPLPVSDVDRAKAFYEQAGFLDSAGVGALVGSRNVLRTRGGSLALVASAGRVLQIIRITGLPEAFPLHSCVIDAITADRHWQAAISAEGSNPGEWCRTHRLL